MLTFVTVVNIFRYTGYVKLKTYYFPESDFALNISYFGIFYVNTTNSIHLYTDNKLQHL